MTSRVSVIISFLCWPVLFAAAMGLSAYGFYTGHPVLYFNISYFSLAVILIILERYFPFERQWLAADKQTLANILHTLVNKGTVQAIIVCSAVVGITNYITPLSAPADTLWPRDWPLFIQVIMVCVIADFMLYWVHRLSHNYIGLWRFHSIHHSVTKLWVVNTGRFHLVDSLLKIAGVIIVLVLLGTPLEAILWFSMITAYIGLMTHCNVNMRSGFMSLLFNTPELHRWHHSRDPSEGNKNYSENITLWDHVFGSYFCPKHQRPPSNIGINEPMPARFVSQLIYPFRASYYHQLHQENKLRTYP